MKKAKRPEAAKPSLTVRISEDRTEAHATVECEEPMSLEAIAERFTAAATYTQIEDRQERHAWPH